MRVPREARSIVQRELARQLPGVLREPLDHAGCSVAAWTSRRLDVGAVRSQQRVRVRMARVERVHGIHVVLEVAVERPRLPFLVAGMLQIEARLERVISACERRGVVDGHERIGARQRETSFEGNCRRIRNGPGERRARDDVERIDRRAELPERVADVIARDGVETFLRQRRARLGAMPVADRELVHERRAQRPRVVQNQAGILECVVLAEQAPVRGAGRDRKTLIVRQLSLLSVGSAVFQNGCSSPSG